MTDPEDLVRYGGAQADEDGEEAKKKKEERERKKAEVRKRLEEAGQVNIFIDKLALSLNCCFVSILNPFLETTIFKPIMNLFSEKEEEEGFPHAREKEEAQGMVKSTIWKSSNRLEMY